MVWRKGSTGVGWESEANEALASQEPRRDLMVVTLGTLKGNVWCGQVLFGCGMGRLWGQRVYSVAV